MPVKSVENTVFLDFHSGSFSVNKLNRTSCSSCATVKEYERKDL